MTLDREQIKSLGWKQTDKKDAITGHTIYHINKEDSFNTGSDYYLTIIQGFGDSFSVVITEEYYGSWSQGKREGQYFLESLEDLKTLMRFKRIV